MDPKMPDGGYSEPSNLQFPEMDSSVPEIVRNNFQLACVGIKDAYTDLSKIECVTAMSAPMRRIFAQLPAKYHWFHFKQPITSDNASPLLAPHVPRPVFPAPQPANVAEASGASGSNMDTNQLTKTAKIPVWTLNTTGKQPSHAARLAPGPNTANTLSDVLIKAEPQEQASTLASAVPTPHAPTTSAGESKNLKPHLPTLSAHTRRVRLDRLDSPECSGAAAVGVSQDFTARNSYGPFPVAGLAQSPNVAKSPNTAAVSTKRDCPEPDEEQPPVRPETYATAKRKPGKESVFELGPPVSTFIHKMGQRILVDGRTVDILKLQVAVNNSEDWAAGFRTALRTLFSDKELYGAEIKTVDRNRLRLVASMVRSYCTELGYVQPSNRHMLETFHSNVPRHPAEPRSRIKRQRSEESQPAETECWTVED